MTTTVIRHFPLPDLLFAQVVTENGGAPAYFQVYSYNSETGRTALTHEKSFSNEGWAKIYAEEYLTLNFPELEYEV